MNLSKRILMKADARLVERINEIYHDLENAVYDDRHGDIWQFEERFWMGMAKKYLVQESPVVCLDYGTGTGFVPLTAGKYLKGEDLLICCDLSAEMLKVCEERIKASGIGCKCDFSKTDGTTIPVDSDSVDAVTVNSVLHHIYDLGSFAKECERILRPGGVLIVAHEPNRNRRLPFPGDVLIWLAKFILRPRTVFFQMAERVPLAESLMRRILSRTSESYRRRNKMLAEISHRLKEEGLIDFDLRGTEIQQIIDFHAQHGFDVEELTRDIFTGFETVQFETFNHLGFATAGKWAEGIDGYIKKRWPDAGQGMRFVLRMPN